MSLSLALWKWPCFYKLGSYIWWVSVLNGYTVADHLQSTKIAEFDRDIMGARREIFCFWNCLNISHSSSFVLPEIFDEKHYSFTVDSTVTDNEIRYIWQKLTLMTNNCHCHKSYQTYIQHVISSVWGFLRIWKVMAHQVSPLIPQHRSELIKYWQRKVSPDESHF